MVTYINRFKSLKSLKKTQNRIIINIFKLVNNANITVSQLYINNEWILTILIR